MAAAASNWGTGSAPCGACPRFETLQLLQQRPQHPGVRHMATIRQIQANQQNAQKSTGPYCTDNTRGNAVKHGLAGRGVVLPKELDELAEERFELWATEFPPCDDFDVASLCLWSITRCGGSTSSTPRPRCCGRSPHGSDGVGRRPRRRGRRVVPSCPSSRRRPPAPAHPPRLPLAAGAGRARGHSRFVRRLGGTRAQPRSTCWACPTKLRRGRTIVDAPPEGSDLEHRRRPGRPSNRSA